MVIRHVTAHESWSCRTPNGNKKILVILLLRDYYIVFLIDQFVVLNHLVHQFVFFQQFHVLFE